MLRLILADIHSNLDAFQAVLRDADRRGKIDEIWCLGDIVGYGPEPFQCIDLLLRYKHLCVAGNHDWAATGKIDTSSFNPDAAVACLWTRKQLGPREKDYLVPLPVSLQAGDFTFVHGSPRDPVWEYLVSPYLADASFSHMKTDLCLVGHSHIPLVFERAASRRCTMDALPCNVPLELKNRLLIINPGSVGQPRDGSPLAGYAIYDSDTHTLRHYRVPYDVPAVQRKMLAAGLPPALAARLSYGW